MSEQFNQLSEFLQNQMKMTHIYQPVMLIHLLQNGGSASATDVAKAILVHDPSQVEYYERLPKDIQARSLQAIGV